MRWRLGTTGGEILEVVLLADFDSTEDVVNVFQFQKTNAGEISNADVIEDMLDVVADIILVLKALVNVLTVFQAIRVKNITDNELLGLVPLPVPIAGTGTGDSEAPGVATLMWFPTGVPHVMGRKFFGTLPESVIGSDAKFTSGHMTNIAAVASVLVNPFTAPNGTYQYGIKSTKTGTWIPFLTAAWENVPAYQRRRRQGRGS